MSRTSSRSTSICRLDGWTFHRELRSQGFEMPVVVMSGSDAKRAQAELRAAAAVAKPLAPGTLVKVVNDLVSSPA